MELPHALKDSGPEWLDVQPLLSRASNDLQVLQYRSFFILFLFRNKKHCIWRSLFSNIVCWFGSSCAG